MLLSIIIPAYNTADFILKILNELVKQKTDEVEIIVVNDGSTDNTKETLDGFEHKDKLRIFHTENKGVSEARNKGIDEAKGEYITYIDSDDMISEDYMKTILAKCKQGNFNYCTFGWSWSSGKIINSIPTWNHSVWNCIYKLNKELRFPKDKSIGEDCDYNKLARIGKGVHLPKVLYYYNCGRPGSLTTEYNKPKNKEPDKPKIRQLVIYQKALSIIGGLEQGLYEFVRTFHNRYDILFLYDHADPKQLLRLKKYVECKQYAGEKIECDKYISWSNQKNIAENVNSHDNFYAVIIHADFKAMAWRFKDNPKNTHIIAVSKTAKKGFDPRKKVQVIYNLLDVGKKERALNLISCTRLSVEKGYEKMIQLAKRMKQRKIPFTWQVLTDFAANTKFGGKIENVLNDYNIIFRQCELDDTPYIRSADYYVTCTRTESWGYSTAKAFELGTPVVATDYPALHEQNAKEGENCFILNQDMSNMDQVIDNMVSKDLRGFKYKKMDDQQQWIDILGSNEIKSEYIPGKDILLKAKRRVYLAVENITVNKGDIFEVNSTERAELIIASGYAELI